MSQNDQDSAIEMPHGVKVFCPEDGGQIKNPVNIAFNDGQITCYDVRSVVNAISMTFCHYAATLANRKQGDGKQGRGPKRAWENARQFAKDYNEGKPQFEHITTHQARLMLSKKKKKERAEELLNKNGIGGMP